MWNPSRPADFPAENLVSQAVPMLDVPSAETKESVSRTVDFTGRPSGYRWNRESTALPLQCCHLFKQIAEKPSEELVFGNPNYPSRKGTVYCSQPLFEFVRCISSTVNLNVQACLGRWNSGHDDSRRQAGLGRACGRDPLPIGPKTPLGKDWGL
jgi:hypothetical protein